MSHLQHQLDDSGSEESLGVGEGENGENSEQEGNRDTAAGAQPETPWWKRGPSATSSFWNLVDEFKESEEGKAYKDREWSEEEYIAYRDFQNARTDEKNRRNNFDRPERRKPKDKEEEGDGDSDVGAAANSKDIDKERPYRGPSMISSFWNLYKEFIDTQGFSADDDPGRDMFHLNERDFDEYAKFAIARRNEKGERNSFDRPRIDKDGNYIKKGQLKGSDKSISNQTKGKGRVDDEEKQLDQVEVDELDGEGFMPYQGSTSMASTDHQAAQTLTKDKLERIEEEKPKELGKYDAKFTERLVHVAKKEMVGTVQNGTLCVLNLSTMQRMNLHAIQRDIAQFAGKIINANGNEADWTELKGLMRDYCQAWQDWRVIEAFAEKKMEEDPFRLLTTNILSKKLMEDFHILPSKPDDFIVDWTVKDKSFLPAYARHATLGKEKIHKSLKLFAWAAGGGLSLIGPMLLMRLHRTLLTQLLTTSLAVMAFGAIVALLAGGLVPYVDQVDLGPQDVLTATAAYAAVLVVFVSQDS